jgi:hypothetical protein
LWYGLWLLKNSLAESARKNRRARMTYKRFSPNADTFLVIRFKPVFGKTEFFNSYGCSELLSTASQLYFILESP